MELDEVVAQTLLPSLLHALLLVILMPPLQDLYLDLLLYLLLVVLWPLLRGKPLLPFPLLSLLLLDLPRRQELY